MPIFAKENVKCFDISVDNVIIMNVVNSLTEFPCEVPDLLFGEILTFFSVSFYQLYAFTLL